MALINGVLQMLFGNGRNVIAEAAEVFHVNKEEADKRAAELQNAALQEFAQEFSHPDRSMFDRVIDGMNRLPRPLLALGTVVLAISAMVDPIWFASRMQGIALVPEPLWWLLGAIISFYFGARYQAKGQEFQRSVAESMAHAPTVVRNLEALSALRETMREPSAAETRFVRSAAGPLAATATPAVPEPAAARAPGSAAPERSAGNAPQSTPGAGPNPALEAWRSSR